MAFRGLVSYWWLPIISALVWVGMLLGMLLYWIVDLDGRPFWYKDANIRVVYISNIGAARLKPLFVTGSCVVCVLLDAAMLASRWLRHNGRLVPNISRGERTLAVLTVIFAVIGTVGLVLLTIFDTVRHHNLHLLFLLFFLAGYMLSAVCTCWEFQRLGIKHRQHRDLRISFWVKLVIVVVEISLAIAFIATNFKKMYNVAAILEWIIAFLFTFFILSFVIDLYPAIYTKLHIKRYDKRLVRHDVDTAGRAGVAMSSLPRCTNGETYITTGAI